MSLSFLSFCFLCFGLSLYAKLFLPSLFAPCAQGALLLSSRACAVAWRRGDFPKDLGLGCCAKPARLTTWLSALVYAYAMRAPESQPVSPSLATARPPCPRPLRFVAPGASCGREALRTCSHSAARGWPKAWFWVDRELLLRFKGLEVVSSLDQVSEDVILQGCACHICAMAPKSGPKERGRFRALNCHMELTRQLMGLRRGRFSPTARLSFSFASF